MSEESPEKFTKNNGLAEELGTIVTKVSRDSPRGELSKNFIMGISDVGSCRERLRRFLKEEPPSDEQNNYMAAFVGTAVGDLVEKNADTWLTQDKVSTVLRIENWDVTLVGTMDMRRPGLLIDNKTKNGTEKLKGPQQEHIWQVSIYALGLIQAGLETEDVTVGICYWDRSGVTQTPVVFTWKFDPEDIKDVQRHLSDVVYALAYNEEAPKDKPRHFCQEWCLAYETEIVTRDGIKQIGSLAGQTVEVLAPSRQGNGLTGGGRWVAAPIREYGVQQLMEIVVRRGRVTKTIFATPEHKWFIRKKNSHFSTERILQTDQLEHGMYLREIKHAGLSSLSEVPFAVAQGFIFGDGGPGSLSIYKKNHYKVMSMLPYFSNTHHVTERDEDYLVNSTPKSWKALPSLSEDGSFLISWLCGYFTADGSVSKNGQATISSAEVENIQYVRSLCAIVGIRTGEIGVAHRLGRGKEVTPLYKMTISLRDLPSWFFKNEHHAERVQGIGNDRDLQWKVIEVKNTDRRETVFCAEVPEVNAFSLADSILTHNCEYYSACRVPDTDVTSMFTDEETVSSVTEYIEIRDEIKALEKRKSSLQRSLSGANGNVRIGDQLYQIRTTQINPVYVSYERPGFTRLDIHKSRKAT